MWTLHGSFNILIPIWRGSVVGQVLEARGTLDERQTYGSGGTVALLGDDQFGLALKIRIIGLIDFFTKDEAHHIGVLLNSARFAQIGKLRTVIPGAVFRSAAQLRESNQGTAHLLRQRLQATGDSRDLLGAVFIAASRA